MVAQRSRLRFPRLEGLLPKRALWRIVRPAIALLAATVFISAIILGGVQWVDQRWENGRDIFLENRGGAPPAPVALHPRYPENFYNEGGWVTLVLVLGDFDPETGEISARVSALFDEAKYQELYPGEQPPNSITLTITGLYGWRVATVPLTAESPQRFEAPSEAVQLEAWGDPRAFPGDSYGSNNVYDIGTNMGWPNITILATQRLAAYDLEASVNDIYLNLLLERKQAEILWIYTILLSPVVLLLSLMWLSRRQRQDAGTAALEVVVGLLALLPLRQVLVPQDITQLTWLDVILGVEFVSFIAWLAYAILFFSGHKSGNS